MKFSTIKYIIIRVCPCSYKPIPTEATMVVNDSDQSALIPLQTLTNQMVAMRSSGGSRGESLEPPPLFLNIL